MDSNNKKGFLNYLVYLPLIFSVFSLFTVFILYNIATNNEQFRFMLLIAFVCSELTMIFSAAAGVIYLISSYKQVGWLRVNIVLFLMAGLTGGWVFTLF